MAIARALACQDILDPIFEHVLDDYTSYAHAQATLASAARVCQAFSGPALDVLWREVSVVLFLFSILPSFEKMSGTLSREPTPEEWDRLWQYGRRVRVIQVNHFVSDSVWKDVLRAQYSTPRRRGPLLPCLTEVGTLLLIPGFPIQCLDVLFSTSTMVRAMRVVIERSTPKQEVNNALQRLYPVLLQVYSLKVLHQSAHRATIPFWEYPQLRTIEVSSMNVIATQRTFNALAALPKLERLRMVLVSFLRHENTKKPIFRALTRLELDFDNLASMSACFSCISFLRLEHIVLRASGAWDGPAFLDILSCLPSESLRSLSMRDLTPPFDMDWSQHHDDYMISILTTLIRCAKLESLSLRSTWGIWPFSDGVLCTILWAWPNLTSLDFQSVYGIYAGRIVRQRSPTIHSLIAFARTHSKLKTLRIPYMGVPAHMVYSEDHGQGTTVQLQVDNVPLLDHRLQKLIIPAWGLLTEEITENEAHGSAEGNPEYRRSYLSVRSPSDEDTKLIRRLFPYLHHATLSSIRII